MSVQTTFAQDSGATGTSRAAKTPLITVTLLGTGVPLIDPVAYVASGRVNAGLMVQAGTERMIFDIGQGVLTRLLQSGGPAGNPNAAVDKVFLSHLHSDHMADLASLYSYGWLIGRTTPLNVWGPGPGPNGPIGISAIMALLQQVWSTDTYIRCCTFKVFTFPAVAMQNYTNELHEGVVYQNNGVKVSAFLVDHYPVTPAYGFRVDYMGHSVIFSGDTKYDTNLIKHSQNADLLIHEVWGYTEADAPELFSYHCPPEDTARVFNATKPKLAVYTHQGIPPGTTAEDLVVRTRAAGYTGPLQLGADLMQLFVYANSISVVPSLVTPSSVPAPAGAVPPEMKALMNSVPQ